MRCLDSFSVTYIPSGTQKYPNDKNPLNNVQLVYNDLNTDTL